MTTAAAAAAVAGAGGGVDDDDDDDDDEEEEEDDDSKKPGSPGGSHDRLHQLATHLVIAPRVEGCWRGGGFEPRPGSTHACPQQWWRQWW